MERSGIKRSRLSSRSPSPFQFQSEEDNGLQESDFQSPAALVEHIKLMDEMYKQQIEKKFNQGNFWGLNEGEGSGVAESLATEDVTMEGLGSSTATGSFGADEQMRIEFLKVILDGKDDEARRDMKERMSGAIGQGSLEDYLRKDSLQALCLEYVQLLIEHFFEVATSTSMDTEAVSQIAKHASNLSWLVDVMGGGEMIEEFVKIWTSQGELISDAYYSVAAPYRYEVIGITAALLVEIGKGFHINLDARYSLLQAWFRPLCDDFEWVKKLKGVNIRLIEHGLGGAIFSMPAKMQHEFLFLWFDMLLNSDKECPRLKGWLEGWWLKSFL